MKKSLALTLFLFTLPVFFGVVAYGNSDLNAPADPEKADLTANITEARKEVRVGTAYRIVTRIGNAAGNGGLNVTNADNSSFRVVLRLVDANDPSRAFILRNLPVAGLSRGIDLDWFFFWDQVPQIRPGSYRLEAFVDADSQIDETNEQNNVDFVLVDLVQGTTLDTEAYCSTEGNACLKNEDCCPDRNLKCNLSTSTCVRKKPDLTVKIDKSPPQIRIGESHGIITNIINKGEGGIPAASPFMARLLLVDANDSRRNFSIRSLEVTGLEAGQQLDWLFFWDVSEFEPGEYALIAFVDSASGTDEADENNNRDQKTVEYSCSNAGESCSGNENCCPSLSLECNNGICGVLCGLQDQKCCDGNVCSGNLVCSSDGSSSGSACVRPTLAPNDPPVFAINSTFSMKENKRKIVTVVANDSDSQDSVTGYSISGGADSSRFTVAGSGGLFFVSAPDYENATDNDRNNQYVVEVTAVSGAGNRTLSASQTITVTVTDVSEPPSAPVAPTLSSLSSTSLSVSWSEPDNAGPAISDYDVQYRKGTRGSFSDWSHSDTSRSATITGLDSNTQYQVRVRASNADGAGNWSKTAAATTGSIPNNPPVFSSSSSFSVQENVLSVGAVVASDSDSQDGIEGYSISGGADSSRFTVAGSGGLFFVSAPDYEGPSDTGNNNVYVLEVAVASGSGSRELSATRTITVTVTDVSEPPSAPVAPTLSSLSSTSLSVSWSEPDNAGPAISDYDVQYRKGTRGSFSDWSHSDTSRSATITGLDSNTQYQVRVRATNAEGVGSWSQISTYTTTLAVNNPPVFSSSSSFSVQENVLSVGAVVASDGDSQDSVTGYGIWSGVDSSLFSITDGGVLTFDSAPNFESPVDYGGNNVYNLVIRATSGTGSRELSATRTITVTVTDVSEPPSAPVAPTLSSLSSTSLSVSWSEPDNAGPAISDYDVQYRKGTRGSFSDWSHSDTSRSATITGLDSNTQYQVRVRATNAEGVGDWSHTASATTASPPQCGGEGQMCCSSGDECGQDLRCTASGDSATCEPCGVANNQQCCDGGVCADDSQLFCVDNICKWCGSYNEPCCDWNPPCHLSLVCDRSGSTDTCTWCGGENQLCCSNGNSCNPGLQCDGSTCQKPPVADLVVAAITVHTDPIVIGENFEITIPIRNEGSVNAGRFKTSLSIVQRAGPPYTKLVKVIDYNGLNAGDSNDVKLTVLLSSGLGLVPSRDRYWFVAHANADGQVTEQNENNNQNSSHKINLYAQCSAEFQPCYDDFDCCEGYYCSYDGYCF